MIRGIVSRRFTDRGLMQRVIWVLLGRLELLYRGGVLSLRAEAPSVRRLMGLPGRLRLRLRDRLKAADSVWLAGKEPITRRRVIDSRDC